MTKYAPSDETPQPGVLSRERVDLVLQLRRLLGKLLDGRLKRRLTLLFLGAESSYECLTLVPF